MTDLCYNAQYYTENKEENNMITYSSNELVSSSELSKKFGTYLLQLTNNTVDKLAILKNNKIEAVLVSKDEYEAMQKALKKVEAEQIIASIKAGINDIKLGNTKPIDTLWNELDN